MKKVLITGAAGFLGYHVASIFKDKGYLTFGIGHKSSSESDFFEKALDHWLECTITLDNIISFNVEFDVIVHCGGSGSVGMSVENPSADFKRSVDSTLAVLEFIRLYNKNAQLIYPSSPAVQGVHDDSVIHENDSCMPVSPYGVHKKIAEDLCCSYRDHFDVNVVIVRFFSIYGPFLRKQLLWDACNKLIDNDEAEFWGSGEETRDFIYVEDAVSFIFLLAEIRHNLFVVNCGSGVRTTIKDLVFLLRQEIGSSSKISFNRKGKDGDPKYYWADISVAKSIGWSPEICLEQGVKKYISWYSELS